MAMGTLANQACRCDLRTEERWENHNITYQEQRLSCGCSRKKFLDWEFFKCTFLECVSILVFDLGRVGVNEKRQERRKDKQTERGCILVMLIHTTTLSLVLM